LKLVVRVVCSFCLFRLFRAFVTRPPFGHPKKRKEEKCIFNEGARKEVTFFHFGFVGFFLFMHVLFQISLFLKKEPLHTEKKRKKAFFVSQDLLLCVQT